VELSDIDTAHAAYRAAPTPENMHSVIKTLEPTIGYCLASLNAANDPILHGKAMLTAADAVQQYDPERGASLPTFVTSQLRQLTREARKQRGPMNLPERVQLDRYKLENAKKEFVDAHGRDPDMLELADHTGLPIKRITKIQAGEMAIGTEGADSLAGASEPDFEKEALDYVYHDGDHTDRRILDLRVGYAGHPTMEPKDAAVVLHLSPAQLSRRSAKLAYKIQKIHSALSSV
jgi:hypothetical protein